MSALTTERHLAELEAQTAGFAELVRDMDQARIVPTCPEWTLDRLVHHVGVSHRWVAEVVARRASELPRLGEVPDRTVPEPPEQRAAWLRAGAARLAAAVREAGPSAPVWTWLGRGEVAFWARRMAAETAVHRADVALMERRELALAPGFAADAISEWLGILATPSFGRTELHGNGETLHFHATDEGLGPAGEWFVTRSPGGIEVEQRHGKGDVAVRGPATSLMLTLLRRIPASDPRLQVLGDEGLLAHWLDNSRF